MRYSEIMVEASEQRYTSLAQVEKLAKRLHVSLNVDEYHDHIVLSWIERVLNRIFAKSGSGAVVIRALCSYADYSDKKVSLEVLGGDKWLMNYYKQFGFKIS